MLHRRSLYANLFDRALNAESWLSLGVLVLSVIRRVVPWQQDLYPVELELGSLPQAGQHRKHHIELSVTLLVR